MKITEEEFNEMMSRNDELNQIAEDLSGSLNSIMDGEEPQQFEFTPEEMDLKLSDIFASHLAMSLHLGVKIEALFEVLSSSTVNRWEVYQIIKGDL